MEKGRVPVTLEEAELLLHEIDRLQAEIAALEIRVKELEALAYVDPLVNLPNRRSFVERLESLIARVDRYGIAAAMLFVDVDGLKQINDTLGHDAGDAALIEIAQMLVATVRKSDTVARLAGDEFAILLEHSDDLSAWQMALRVVETVVGSQFCLNGVCLPLSVAVGVAAIQPGDDPQSVIKRADQEMYHFKAPKGSSGQDARTT